MKMIWGFSLSYEWLLTFDAKNQGHLCKTQYAL